MRINMTLKGISINGTLSLQWIICGVIAVIFAFAALQHGVSNNKDKSTANAEQMKHFTTKMSKLTTAVTDLTRVMSVDAEARKATVRELSDNQSDIKDLEHRVDHLEKSDIEHNARLSSLEK